jgi:hypothetical protein
MRIRKNSLVISIIIIVIGLLEEQSRLSILDQHRPVSADLLQPKVNQPIGRIVISQQNVDFNARNRKKLARNTDDGKLLF